MDRGRPALETIIEEEASGMEVLHSGGLEITRELAERCRIQEGVYILDVASGTGESACFLAETYGCRVVGVDHSASMVERAREKARARGLDIEFRVADAHQLPFPDDTFDVALSECTVGLLDKTRALGEMVRVVRSGGYVGIHDLCWKGDVPVRMKQRLAEIEGERPETLEGWKVLFERAGLVDVVTVDKPDLIPVWTKEFKERLGIGGQVRIFLKALRRWGPGGLRSVLVSQRIFQSPHMGYGVIVGRKP